MNFKKIVSYLPDWVLLPLASIVFIITWPFVFVILGIKTLFDDDIAALKKIVILKEIVLTLFIFGIFLLIYLIVGEPQTL